MTNEQLQKFKDNILERQRALHQMWEGLESELRAIVEDPLILPDPLDEAKELSDRNQRMGMFRHIERQAGKLARALRRIDMGIFGVCEGCEEEIDPRRLDAQPDCTFCIECQEFLENGGNGKPEARVVSIENVVSFRRPDETVERQTSNVIPFSKEASNG